MTKPRIILDCDPGLDDAIAILMASRFCELLGITTVSGNVGLDKTTRNALLTTQLLGLEVPVHAGAERPLVAEPSHSAYIHGETGLDGPALPRLEREVAGHDAAQFLIDTARRQDDVWLVAIGPLTNVALALQRAPDIAGRLKGISLMGGSASFGNITPAAEFNIWADPEAADIVFASGANLVMCGLNLTHQFLIGPEARAHIEALDNDAARFVSGLLATYGQAYAKLHPGYTEGPLHDPCAVLAVSHPELFELRARHVRVETAGRLTRGMTVVDERGLIGAEPANTQVAYRIDAEKGLELLLDAIRSSR